MRRRFPLQYLDGATLTLPREHLCKPMIHQQSFRASVDCALGGLRYAFATQRNLRLQLWIGSGIFLLALGLRFPFHEVALVVTLMALVLFAELMNTALELFLDRRIGTMFDPAVKAIKDIAAGAVLVVCVGASALGAATFLPHLRPLARWLAHPDHPAMWCGGLALLGTLLLWGWRTRERHGLTSGVCSTPALDRHQRTPRPAFRDGLGTLAGGVLLLGTALLALALVLIR